MSGLLSSLATILRGMAPRDMPPEDETRRFDPVRLPALLRALLDAVGEELGVQPVDRIAGDEAVDTTICG